MEKKNKIDLLILGIIYEYPELRKYEDKLKQHYQNDTREYSEIKKEITAFIKNKDYNNIDLSLSNGVLQVKNNKIKL